MNIFSAWMGGQNPGNSQVSKLVKDGGTGRPALPSGQLRVEGGGAAG
jgi:hypothetical protein